ncbi:MAG: translation initiation factor IF-2 N-terminal domain-containing protein, partial [Arcobacteraceae bacterium]
MSDSVRVYEIADETGSTSTEVIAKAKDLNIELKSPQSTVSFEDAEEIAKYLLSGTSDKLVKKPKAKKVVEEKKEEEPQAVETTPQNREIKVEQKKEVELEKETTLKRVDAKKPSAVAITKTTPKPAMKKVEDVSFDVSNNEEDETNNSGRIIPKRRGLKIVKKKQPKEEQEEIKEVTSSFNQ